jgi:gamma-glutamyltranspeptidase/glutathione hydrolase
VSLIQSNFFGFGSGIEVAGAGYLLHNRGSGFTLVPGHPNQLGPGKRPLHTLSPTLWTDGPKLRALLGTRGGDFQPQLILQMAAALFWCRLSPEEAQHQPRWVISDHRAVEPAVTVEGDVPSAFTDLIVNTGFDVERVPPRQPGWGPVSVILDDGSRVRGAADPRVSTTLITGQP